MEFSYKERLLFLMKLATKIADRFVIALSAILRFSILRIIVLL